MNHKEYNGWWNYETWVVKLWMDNDSGACDYWAEKAKAALEECDLDADEAVCELARAIQEEHEENTPTVTGAFADLLNAALSEVNWHEIAEHLIDDAKDPLRNVEVFEVNAGAFLDAYALRDESWHFARMAEKIEDEHLTPDEAAGELAGFYWWSSQPGCLPDTDACGPFDSEHTAERDAWDTNS